MSSSLYQLKFALIGVGLSVGAADWLEELRAHQQLIAGSLQGALKYRLDLGL